MIRIVYHCHGHCLIAHYCTINTFHQQPWDIESCMDMALETDACDQAHVE